MCSSKLWEWWSGLKVLYTLGLNAVPSVYKYCTKCVQVLHQVCTSTAPSVYKYCTKCVQVLHQVCTSTAPSLYKYCTKCVQVLYQVCTSTVPSVYKYCTKCVQGFTTRGYLAIKWMCGAIFIVLMHNFFSTSNTIVILCLVKSNFCTGT